MGRAFPTPLFFSKIPDDSDLDSPIAGEDRLAIIYLPVLETLL